jgi:hypothetical protein
MIRLRQATGYTGILSSQIQESAKLDRMMELIADARENGQQVVIFSNWSQMTDEICERIHGKYTYVSITGDTKDNERQKNVEAFQDGRAEIIVGTTGAMGTGLTLTAGTVEIFLDEPWSMALREQAVDRCHRIGFPLIGHMRRDPHCVIINAVGDSGCEIIKKNVLDAVNHKCLAGRWHGQHHGYEQDVYDSRLFHVFLIIEDAVICLSGSG